MLNQLNHVTFWVSKVTRISPLHIKYQSWMRSTKSYDWGRGTSSACENFIRYPRYTDDMKGQDVEDVLLIVSVEIAPITPHLFLRFQTCVCTGYSPSDSFGSTLEHPKLANSSCSAQMFLWKSKSTILKITNFVILEMHLMISNTLLFQHTFWILRRYSIALCIFRPWTKIC